MMLLALFSIGFSLGALLLLAFVLAQRAVQGEKYAGACLLLALVAIQSMNSAYLWSSYDVWQARVYLLCLYVVAPSFYFYSRQLLRVNADYQTADVLHTLPLLCALILPYGFALPLSFLIGVFYLLWLTKIVYDLRAQRQRFRLELFALAVLFSIALCVVLLGFVLPLLTQFYFIVTYSVLIASALFAVLLTVLHFPSITVDVSEAVQAAYQVSTLKNINKTQVLTELSRLMQDDKLYRLDSLSLESVAEQLQLSAHQLSELINSEFNFGFSRYIRQYRIAEAKQLLLTEPNVSVLAIGLSVGFHSQSNFYAAFRELEHISPGQYRKLHL